LAKSANGEGVVALGEADTVFGCKELGVEVGGAGKVKRALEEELAGSGCKEIAPTRHFGDIGLRIVDYTGRTNVVADLAISAKDKVCS
jgi:hypothetical protein